MFNMSRCSDIYSVSQHRYKGNFFNNNPMTAVTKQCRDCLFFNNLVTVPVLSLVAWHIKFCFDQNDCADWADSKRAHEAEMRECICHAHPRCFYFTETHKQSTSLQLIKRPGAIKWCDTLCPKHWNSASLCIRCTKSPLGGKAIKSTKRKQIEETRQTHSPGPPQ